VLAAALGLRLLAAVGVWSAGSEAVAAEPPACAAPVLQAGQEQAVSRMVTPAPASGWSAGDTRVLGERIVTELRRGETRLVYVLAPRPRDPSPPATPLRTVHFAISMVLPCLRPPDAIGLGSLGGLDRGAKPSAVCPLAAEELDAADLALVAAIRAGEAAVRWICPATETPETPLTLGLRQMDEALRLADPAAAQRALDAAMRAQPPETLGIPARVDLGMALLRVGRHTEAAAHLQAALAKDKALPLPESATNISPEAEAGLPGDLGVAVRWARMAAAKAALGDAPGGRALLEGCWQRLGECDATPLAAALELVGPPGAAEALLDAWLARSPRPSPAQFRARIGLASRRNDSRAELATAEAATKAWPADLGLRDALATACFRAGQHERAVRLFESIFRQDPSYLGVLGRLSGVFNDMGRVDDLHYKATPDSKAPSDWLRLKQEMQARAARDPADHVARFLHAVSLFYEGSFEASLVEMAKVEPYAPREGRVFIYQAMAHLWLGRPQQAEMLLQKALAANPHDPDVYYCQSQVVRRRDPKLAAVALERYIALSAAPGALQFPKKTERVREELALLQQGRLPPDWDRPGHSQGPVPEASKPKVPWQSLAAGLAVLGGLTWLVRRRLRPSTPTRNP